MALMRSRSRLTTPAPPPSPIPTARGSRSAANQAFVEFLDKSIQLPHLKLPESARRSIPADIDFRSLSSPGSGYCITQRLLESAKEFGAFRITNHGISGEELWSLLKEAECVFTDPEMGVNLVERYGNREKIVWDRSPTHRMEWTTRFIAAERYRNFRREMESVANKLEAIAEQITGVICESMGDKFQKETKEKETTFTLHRYNHECSSRIQQNQMLREELLKADQVFDNDNALRLHIPGEHCQFHLQSSLSTTTSSFFDADMDTIVVTVGKQLQEWSIGELKGVTGEMIFVPDLHRSQSSSLSIEVKFSSANLIHGVEYQHSKTISISSQLLFAIIIPFLYHLFVFICSRFTRTQ